MPVSLSASISQSQEPLRKKIFGNHGNILFWLLKSKQRTAIAVDNRKKKIYVFVLQKSLLIKFFQKQSSQMSRHQHTVKIIFSTKLPFLCRNRENSRENK